MAISDELKALYVTAPNDTYYLETLTLSHPEFISGTRYITNVPGGFLGTLETAEQVFFTYAPFTVLPPDLAEQAALTLKCAIDNTSKQLMQELETLATQPTEPIKMVYRIYVSGDPDTVQNDPPLELEINSVNATVDAIAFNAGITNLRGKPFPSVLYTTERFPGLQR